MLLPAGMSFLHAQSDSSASGPAEQPVNLEAYTVTGTRLRSLVGEQTTLPVFTLSAVEMEQRGVTRLADLRWAIPQLGASQGYNDNLVNGGPSRAQMAGTSFNLRGLGGNSTLVLIDGRRVPHTGQSAPGGAGGREDFNIDGIPVSAIDRVEVLPQGAGAIYGSEAIAGVINVVLKKNYRGGEVSFSYDNTFESDAAQRTVSLTGGYTTGKLSTFVTVSQTDANRLDAVDRSFLRGTSPSSLIYSPYAGAGTLAPDFYPNEATMVGIPVGSKGAGFSVADAEAAPIGERYDSTYYASVFDESRSRSVVFKADYNARPWLRPYLQVRWAEFENFYVGTFNTLSTQLPAVNPGNPYDTPIYVAKVFYDLPRPTTDSVQENSGVSFGVSGDLPKSWRYDAGFSWARNVVSDESRNSGFNFGLLTNTVKETLLLAYDSSTVSDPNPGEGVRAFLNNTDHEDTTDVYQTTVTADGPIWEGWAGPIMAAVGAEMQTEEVEFYNFPVISYLLQDAYDRDVSAVFTEINVPLVGEQQGIPLVHRVAIGGAVRYEDFSDIGEHTTPGVNALYQPVAWATLRASRTEGFKAPKLYDLRGPRSTFYPRSITARSGVVDTLRNNEPVIGDDYTLVSGGQPDLNPETSVSRNLGLLVEVPGVKGLSFSVDIWETDFDDRVSSPSYQDLINYFPERVTRAASSGGQPGVITGFDTSVINQTRVEMGGMDYRAIYQRIFPAVGEVMISLAVSDPDAQVSQATPSSPWRTLEQPMRGTGSLFWTRGSWTAGVAVNYQESFITYAGDTTWTPSYIEWNPQVSYDVPSSVGGPDDVWWKRALSNTELSLTVINVFNAQPDSRDEVNTLGYAMDPRLSRYIVTLTKRF